MEKEINSCLFCEKFNMIKDFNERHLEDPFKSKFNAVLMEEIYREKELRATVKHAYFELNYCPTCGKSLKEALNNGNPIPATGSGEI